MSSPSSRAAALNAAVLCAIEVLESRRLLSAGQLDPTFGNGGVVTDNTLPRATTVAVQSDGKVVEAAQFFGHVSLARFNADGSPDTGFGYFGRLTSDIGGVTKVSDLVLQPDGKILIAGAVNGDFLLTRYNPNGSVDTTFNHTGVVTTDFGFDEEAHGIALTADHKIVAAGISVNGVIPGSDLAIARYNADGSLDTTFNGTGTNLFGGVGIARFSIDDVAVGADLRPVVVGASFGKFGSFFLVQRFNADGTPDNTQFAAQNRVSQDEEYNAVAIQTDGKIIAAGEANAVLSRYNANGTLDSSFGIGGSIDQSVNGAGLSMVTFRDVLLQTDGKIVAAGTFNPLGSHDFYLARYKTDGTLDATFGTNGSTDTQLGLSEQLTKIALGPDDKIVAAGGALSQLDLARYTADGSVVASGATISGTIFTDTNGNGVRDPGETALAGRQVYLDLQGIDTFVAGDPLAITDANGTYSFTHLAPGNYLVRPLPQSGQVITSPVWGGKYFVQLGTNQTISGEDFLIEPIAAPISFSQYLLVPGTSNGSATLSRFNAGDTSVDAFFGTFGVVTLPAAVTGQPTLPHVNPDGSLTLHYATQTVTIAFNGAILSIVPSGSVNGSISGTVYDDANNNGVRDAGEAAVAGRQVYLDLQGVGVFNAGDPIVTTDASGRYSFTNLPAANYLVRLVPQADRVITAPIWGGKFFVQLGQNQTVTGDDFGTENVTGLTATQADGKLLVAGHFFLQNYAAVSRFNPDGSVDTTFDRGSLSDVQVPIGTTVLSAVNAFSTVTQFFPRPDGSILVQVQTAVGFGSSHLTSTVVTLELLSPTGQEGGTAIIGVTPNAIADHYLLDRVALTPDNKILAAGTQTHLTNGSGPANLYVRRYNADLTPDLTFGSGGGVTIAGYGEPDSVAGLADGRVVLTYQNLTLTLSSSGAVLV